MKKIVGLMTAFILLLGCATVPENKSNTDRKEDHILIGIQRH